MLMNDGKKMYQRAEICFPRKKRVPDSFHANTYRIFNENAPERLDSSQVYKDHTYPSRSAEEIALLQTFNNPQPQNARFIRTNVRWLNEPVSHIVTENTANQESQWWPNTADRGVTPKPPYSHDSIQRSDFCSHAHLLARNTRGGCNPQTTPASAIIPSLVAENEPKVLQERISFTQQYDSRRLRDQPFQGKKHGAFVWKDLAPLVPSPSGGSVGGAGFSREDLFHSARRRRVTPSSSHLGRNLTPSQSWGRDRALSGTGTPPQPSTSTQFRTGGPRPKHIPSEQEWAAGAWEKRDRIQSLEPRPAALPSLPHWGRNSLP